MSHPLAEMMDTILEKIRTMVDVNTVVGDPIVVPNDVTIIPISRISYGFGSGGGDYTTKNPTASGTNPFGGGVGAGITITPISFLVLKGESVRMLPIAEPAGGTVDRLVEMVPDLIDKVTALFKKEKEEKTETTEI